MELYYLLESLRMSQAVNFLFGYCSLQWEETKKKAKLFVKR